MNWFAFVLALGFAALAAVALSTGYPIVGAALIIACLEQGRAVRRR